MNKYIVLFALLCLAASAFALSLPIDKSKLKFPKIPKCYCIRAPCHCGGQWDEESDIAWVPVAIWAGKALGAGALGAAGAHAYDKIFRRKDDVESEFPLGAIFTAYNLYKKFKKDNVESDFGKFFKKIGGVVKKGVSLYGKAKGLGFFDDAESDREFRDQLIAKLKDRVKSKLQKQLKEDSISKKLCVLTKLRAKPFCASRAKVESDKINFKNLFSQKNLEKAIGIYKAIKGDAEESDAEFLSKLKNWWNNKGKGLFEKGKNLFNKGKEIYAILKNKGEETESEKINWSGIKKYLTPENLQKAVDIWKILKGKDAVESDFYGQVAKFLAQKGVEQLGKLGYNKIFRRDDAEEQAPAEKPKRKPKSEKKGVTLKGLVAKLRKQRAEKEGKPEKKSGKWAMFEKLMKRFKKNKKSTEEGQKSEKPKRKFDLKSLIAKLSKQKKQKKEKKEKKVEEPQQVNDQASG